MSRRTEIVCIHEGERNKRGMLNSIDPIFASAFFNAYKPSWVRGGFRSQPCGDKSRLLERFPIELKACSMRGGNTTLIVIADVDDDCKDCDTLKSKYHAKAKDSGIPDELFKKVVFIFPKDRIENWIEFLRVGVTDENKEGPRVEPAVATITARKLAYLCKQPSEIDGTLPPSLQWSCRNWRALVARMRNNS